MKTKRILILVFAFLIAVCVFLSNREIEIECKLEGTKFDSDNKFGMQTWLELSGSLKFSAFKKSQFKGDFTMDNVEYSVFADFLTGTHVANLVVYKDGDPLDCRIGLLLTRDFKEIVIVFTEENNTFFFYPAADIESAQKLFEDLSENTIYQDTEISLSI